MRRRIIDGVFEDGQIDWSKYNQSNDFQLYLLNFYNKDFQSLRLRNNALPTLDLDLCYGSYRVNPNVGVGYTFPYRLIYWYGNSPYYVMVPSDNMYWFSYNPAEMMLYIGLASKHTSDDPNQTSPDNPDPIFGFRSNSSRFDTDIEELVSLDTRDTYGFWSKDGKSYVGSVNNLAPLLQDIEYKDYNRISIIFNI